MGVHQRRREACGPCRTRSDFTGEGLQDSLRLCRGRFRKKSRTQMIRQRPQRRSQGLTRTSSLLSLPNPNPTPRILFFSLLRSPQEIIAKKNSIRLLTSTSIPKLPAKDHKSIVAPPARLRACSVRERELSACSCRCARKHVLTSGLIFFVFYRDSSPISRRFVFFRNEFFQRSM